jgi:hypothetical protein
VATAEGGGAAEASAAAGSLGMRRAVRVCPADWSRSARRAPIAVAGVRTPARSGRRSRSRARQSTLSPSMTDVAAWVTSCFGFAQVAHPGGGAGVDLDAEKARAAGLVAGALAGAGQDRAQQRPRGRERQPCRQRLHTGRQRGGPRGCGRAGTEAGDFPVAEPAPVGPAVQGVAAAHHPGVEAGHDKRPHPDPQAGVVAGPHEVSFVTEVGLGPPISA